MLGVCSVKEWIGECVLDSQRRRRMEGLRFFFRFPWSFLTIFSLIRRRLRRYAMDFIPIRINMIILIASSWKYLMQEHPRIILRINKMRIKLIFLNLLIRFLQYIRLDLINIKEINELIEINWTAKLIQLLV